MWLSISNFVNMGHSINISTVVCLLWKSKLEKLENNGLIRKDGCSLVLVTINRAYNAFAAFEEVSGPKICTTIRNDTVNARKEVEKVKSKRDGSKGQVIKKRGPPKKSGITTVFVKSFQWNGMPSRHTIEAMSADSTCNWKIIRRQNTPICCTQAWSLFKLNTELVIGSTCEST